MTVAGWWPLRADVDDATPTLLPRVRQDGARHADRRDEVEVQYLEPLVVGELVERHATPYSAGIVYQHVNRSEMSDGLLDQPLYLRGIRHVGGDGQHLRRVFSVMERVVTDVKH